jgi:translocator protein
LKFKPNFLVIPALIAAVSWLGSLITSANMDWYRQISKPAWTPPGSVIGTVWTIIFILTAISIIIVWNNHRDKKEFKLIIFFFALNLLLNIGWSAIFFGAHLIGLAFFEALILDATVLVLILLIWKHSKTAALLLAPYFLWVAFASYLTYTIWMMN